MNRKPAPAPGARDVFAIAWPMTLRGMFLFGTVVIDGYLVSSLGETAIAAMGLAAATAGFVLGVVFAFANAMQIRAAQVSGTGNLMLVKSTIASGLALNLVLGGTGLGLVWLAGPALLAAMAQTDEVAALAWDYLSVFSLVVIGESVAQCLGSYFNGRGRTRLPLYGYCLSVPVNVAVSAALIHGLGGLPAMGITGAALGSAVAIGVQAGFLCWQFWRLDRDLAKVPGWHRGSFAAALKWHILFALPIAATFVSANFAGHVSTLIFANLDVHTFAAFTLIMPWIQVVGTVGMQWAQATGIIVAQLLGQERPPGTLDRFLASAWRGAFVTSAVVAVIYATVCLAAPWIYDGLDPVTLKILASFLPVLVFLPFPKGSNAICGNTLRASGDTVHVMFIFLSTQWLFRVPASALVVMYLDVSPVWVLSVLLWEEILKFPLFHRRLWRGDWKAARVGE